MSSNFEWCSGRLKAFQFDDVRNEIRDLRADLENLSAAITRDLYEIQGSQIIDASGSGHVQVCILIDCSRLMCSQPLGAQIEDPRLSEGKYTLIL